METFTLDLNPQPAARGSRFLQRAVILLLGIVNLIIALWLQGPFRYVNLSVGMVIIILAVLYRRIYTARVVRFEQEQIAGALTPWHDAVVPWEDVLRMEATKSHLIIRKKSGEALRMSLSNITLHQESEVLPKLIGLASSKGIEVQNAR